MSKRAKEKAKVFQDSLDYHQSMSMWPEDAYLKGYEQAEKDLGWHSVGESLPPMDEEVIVLTNVVNGRVVDTARYICFGHIVNKEICVDYDGWNIPGVKYWMPCPKLEELK